MCLSVLVESYILHSVVQHHYHYDYNLLLEVLTTTCAPSWNGQLTIAVQTEDLGSTGRRMDGQLVQVQKS